MLVWPQVLLCVSLMHALVNASMLLTQLATNKYMW